MAARTPVSFVACCLFFFITSTISKPFDVCRYSVSLCGSIFLHPTDRAILLEINTKYNLYADDWNVSLTCAKGWSGVCIDKNGRVTELSLDIVSSSFPNSFGRLEKLLYLKLKNYYYFSSLPPTLGSLTNLRQLSIISSHIYTLPFSLASLSKLTHLTLECQVDESILPEISKLTNLIHLELKATRFRLLPTDAFSSLKKLVNLYIVNNYYLRFTSIPSLKGLVSLKILDLRENKFSGAIPASFASLKNLTTLLLDGNSLCGNIPPNLSNLPKLRTLNVSDNFLSGKVPSVIVRKFCGKLPYSFSGNCFTSSSTCGKSKEAYMCTNGCNLIPGTIKNIARFGSSHMSSSTLGDEYSTSSLAIDGSSGYGNFSSRTCVRTVREIDPYLQINFDDVYHMKTVKLYNRLDCCGNWLNGVRVYVGKNAYIGDGYENFVACVNPNFTYGSKNKGFPLSVTCNKKGKSVRIVVPGNNKVLSVCEVAIFEK